MDAPVGAARVSSRDRGQPRLAPCTRRTTDDRDQAEQIIAELFLPHPLDLSRGLGPLSMEVGGLRLGALTAARLKYGRRVRLGTADAEKFHVNIPLRGRVVSWRGVGEPVTTRPGEGVIFSPGETAEMAWSADCEQLCLTVPRARLEADLEELLGRPLRGRLIDGLLLGQPHSHTDAATGDRRAGRRSASIRRAVELLEERPSEPWTTRRLASGMHLGVRALQEGFRRDLATPPMTYLRQVRLRRAREALQAADRDPTTVNAVAMSVGIPHMGRFAAACREAFCESPSHTLNRPSYKGRVSRGSSGWRTTPRPRSGGPASLAPSLWAGDGDLHTGPTGCLEEDR